MIYDNNEITAITYSGYNIVRAYSCGGEVVFSVEPTPPTPTGGTKLTCYNSSGQTYYTLGCNGDGTLGRDEWLDDYWDTYGYGARYTVTDVIIGDCVTTIGYQAFETMDGALSSVTIPDSVISIGQQAFDICKSLTNVTIGSGVTSIGKYAFRDCISLTSITIPDSVTSIGANAFYYCRSLSSVTIGSGITTIGNDAFNNCQSLTSFTCLATTPPTISETVFYVTNNCPIYVPCDSVNAYKSASGWSEYASRIQGNPNICPNVKFSATYSGGTTYSAECDSNTTLTTATTKPSGYNASRMTSAEIGDCITSIGNDAFYNCSSLTSIDIPNSVTSIGSGAFEICTSLTNVTIGSGVTSIGDYAFDSCRSLTGITINAITPPTLNYDDIMDEYTSFNNTNNCPIYVPASSVNTYKSAIGWAEYASRIQAIQ